MIRMTLEVQKYWPWWLQQTNISFRRSFYHSLNHNLIILKDLSIKFLKELNDLRVPPKLSEKPKSDNSLVRWGPKDPVCFRVWSKVHSDSIRRNWKKVLQSKGAEAQQVHSTEEEKHWIQYLLTKSTNNQKYWDIKTNWFLLIIKSNYNDLTVKECVWSSKLWQEIWV